MTTAGEHLELSSDLASHGKTDEVASLSRIKLVELPVGTTLRTTHSAQNHYSTSCTNLETGLRIAQMVSPRLAGRYSPQVATTRPVLASHARRPTKLELFGSTVPACRTVPLITESAAELSSALSTDNSLQTGYKFAGPFLKSTRADLFPFFLLNLALSVELALSVTPSIPARPTTTPQWLPLPTARRSTRLIGTPSSLAPTSR